MPRSTGLESAVCRGGRPADGGSVGTALQKTGRYDVVPLVLTSETDSAVKLLATTATKDDLRTVLHLLAGRDIPAGNGKPFHRPLVCAE